MTLLGRNTSDRAGRYLRQLQGDLAYYAFVPKPLPPDPSLILDTGMVRLIADASLALGRLEGASELLPNPDLFVAMYVRKEALVSSQIEGTQASLDELLEFEARVRPAEPGAQIREVVNYVDAMNYGLERVEALPVSIRLLREIHVKLLQGTRGGERTPGELRTTQNWVGAPGSTLREALYIPPPPSEVVRCLGELEAFIHQEDELPMLIKCGLIHSQFETIHPFLDGNGRLGRLLVTFLLCQNKILTRPLLYLSAFFKRHQGEYYTLLQRVRDEGVWEEWLRFFLRGLRVVAEEATQNIRAILKMREEHRVLLVSSGPRSSNSQALLDYLFQYPYLTVTNIQAKLKVSFGTANRLAQFLQEKGLLTEVTGRQRNRYFAYEPYLTILRQDIV
ncbi:MAG: Fic family protein [Chloroflexi bacterium]|nr:Fic family protein [Chloroflexota bacterium]